MMNAKIKIGKDCVRGPASVEKSTSDAFNDMFLSILKIYLYASLTNYRLFLRMLTKHSVIKQVLSLVLILDIAFAY